MNPPTKYVFRAGIRTVTVRATSYEQADLLARERLDDRVMREGGEPPVGWDLRLVSKNGKNP